MLHPVTGLTFIILCQIVNSLAAQDNCATNRASDGLLWTPWSAAQFKKDREIIKTIQTGRNIPGGKSNGVGDGDDTTLQGTETPPIQLSAMKFTDTEKKEFFMCQGKFDDKEIIPGKVYVDGDGLCNIYFGRKLQKKAEYKVLVKEVPVKLGWIKQNEGNTKLLAAGCRTDGKSHVRVCLCQGYYGKNTRGLDCYIWKNNDEHGCNSAEYLTVERA